MNVNKKYKLNILALGIFFFVYSDHYIISSLLSYINLSINKI